MKATFTDEEVQGLPEEVRTKIKDNKFDGPPGDFIPDVSGLKSGLEKERTEKRAAQKLVKAIADKFGAKKSTILKAVDDLIASTGQKGEALKMVATENIRTVIAQYRGNPHLLAANVEKRVEWNEEAGQYIVPGEDGEPLKTDDGALKGVRDVVMEMKETDAFKGAFAASDASGTGSPPQKGADGRTGLPNDGRSDSDAPPKSMRISDMNSQQRRLAATEGGGLQEYPR